MRICRLEKVLFVIRGILPLLISGLKDLNLLLSSVVVVLACSPVVVELGPNLPVSPLDVSLNYKGVLKQLRPSEPVVGRLVQETLQEGLELGRHVLWELDGILNDQVDQGVDRVGVKGRRPNKELVDNDSQRPQIDSVVVGQFLHQLWSHVQRSSLDRGEHDGVGRHRPGEPEVTELDDAVCRDKDVLRLHVSMNDAVRVQVVQGVDKLLGYLPHFVLWQVAIVFQDLKQLSLRKLSDHAELMGGFEGVEQKDDVFMVQSFQDVNLLAQVVEFLLGLSSAVD